MKRPADKSILQMVCGAVKDGRGVSGGKVRK